MSLKETLLSDMKVAMKEKDILRKNTIQMLRGAILQKEKDTLHDISEEEILDLVMQEIKKRRDAITDFEKAGRQNLISDTEMEINILQGYLPKQLEPDEIEQIVEVAISETGASSMKDMGKVMAYLMPKVKGKADNKVLSSVVKQKLS